MTSTGSPPRAPTPSPISSAASNCSRHPTALHGTRHVRRVVLARPRRTRPRGLWNQLTDWVGYLRSRYPLARKIPACWAEHPEIVEELTALWLAWQSAYQDRDAPLTAPADWHDRWLPASSTASSMGPSPPTAHPSHQRRPDSAYAAPDSAMIEQGEGTPDRRRPCPYPPGHDPGSVNIDYEEFLKSATCGSPATADSASPGRTTSKTYRWTWWRGRRPPRRRKRHSPDLGSPSILKLKATPVELSGRSPSEASPCQEAEHPRVHRTGGDRATATACSGGRRRSATMFW